MDLLWHLLLSALLAQGWSIQEHVTPLFTTWVFTPPAINGSARSGSVVVLRTPTNVLGLHQVVGILAQSGFDSDQYWLLVELHRDRDKE